MTDTLTQICPRREGMSDVFKLPAIDRWDSRAQFGGDNGLVDLHCSYCGSLHPDQFMDIVETVGHKLGPTDKDYKVYVNTADGKQTKFYFYHLSVDQKKHFVGLYNEKKLNLDMPGHFYVLPFFMVRQ